MKTIAFSLLLVLCALNLNAQNQNDALRYSRHYFEGTARATSLGGAMTAIGGDLSAMTSNPAGVAIFKVTNFALTPSFQNLKISTNFSGNNEIDNKYKFSLNNLGIATSFKTESETGLISINFGVTYNRINNYNRNMLISGINQNGSLLTSILPADGASSNDLGNYGFATQLAYDAYLIDTVPGTNLWGNPLWHDPSDLTWKGQNVQRIVTTTGGMGAADFVFGANINNQVYIGASFGMVNFTHNEIITHTESNSSPQLSDLKNFTFKDEINSSGSGYNIKLGIIYTPTEFLRLGASVHTPSFISFTDKRTSSITANYYVPFPAYSASKSTNYNYNKQSDDLKSDLTTPMKATAGFALMNKDLGFISFDVEMIDYSSSKLRAADYDFISENKAIQTDLKKVFNYRAGAEFRTGILSLRGGLAFYGSPYTDAKREKATRTSLSAGLGINAGDFFIDFAYVYTKMKTSEFMYDILPNESVPVADYTNSQMLMTLGFRF